MEQILHNYAERLGLQEESVIRKAEEFLRVYQSKPAIKNLSDVAKSIMCLDLAATNLGTAFDQKHAVKLSGLKTQYFSHLRVLEKVLHLDKVLTIQELCVQLGCTAAIKTAEHILHEYKRKHQIRLDFDHPQYISAAVYTACRVKGIKLEKSKLCTSSQLKPAQWKELITSFKHFFDSLDTAELQETKKKRDLLVLLEDISNKNENPLSPSKKKCVGDEKTETYEEWRERILEESYQALKT